MPDTPSLVLAKSFSYRGAAETWTNKYHFLGTTPTDRTTWRALIQAVWNSERAFLGSDVTLVGASGYVAGNEAAAQMFDSTNLNLVTGTGAGALNTSQGTPGDTAIWCRWKTDLRNSKNKPIYLRKYYHGIPVQADGDLPISAVVTGLSAHAQKCIDGTLPGGFRVCAPQGAPGVVFGTAQFVTTRTLKRNARTPT